VTHHQHQLSPTSVPTAKPEIIYSKITINRLKEIYKIACNITVFNILLNNNIFYLYNFLVYEITTT